jgi:hypothetical protein
VRPRSRAWRECLRPRRNGAQTRVFDDSAAFLFGALSEIDHLVLEHDAPAASIALLRQHHPALDITITTKAAA